MVRRAGEIERGGFTGSCAFRRKSCRGSKRGGAPERKELRREYELKVQSGEWPAHETSVPLFPYQREGMLHLAFTERALLADEMGLGKTIQAIAACALLRRLGPGTARAGRHARVAQGASGRSKSGSSPICRTRLVFGGLPARREAYDGGHRFSPS